MNGEMIGANSFKIQDKDGASQTYNSTQLLELINNSGLPIDTLGKPNLGHPLKGQFYVQNQPKPYLPKGKFKYSDSDSYK